MTGLTDFDRYLFNEGTLYRAYEKLGAHLRVVDGVSGVFFAVWAPAAEKVSVVGDFNCWDGRVNPMRPAGSTGIWESFVPGLGEGGIYKYEIGARSNGLFLKADPYAFFSEVRPRTGSVVWDVNKYQWQDREWLAARQQKHGLNEPLSVYEVHLGSWRRGPNNTFLNYREIAVQLAEYVRQTGFTHVEILPVTEHPLDESWGYQATGYFSPTSRFGTPDDFAFFVDYLHQNGIGVIMDWVPAHFPKDDYSLARFDGTALYEHLDPRQAEHKDWGTLIFNYGRHEVANFLTNSALFWLDKYHIDGLRLDAVAAMLYLDYSRKPGEWIPNKYGGRENLEAVAFLKQLNRVVYDFHPDVFTAAEESTAWPMVSRPTDVGGLGFGYKWNMGWMNDTLAYLRLDPVYRKHHHQNLTFGLLYAFTENFVLPFSHDEVVHGKGSLLAKMPGDDWQKFANLRLLLGYFYAHPGKKLLFMGGELGQRREWDCGAELEWQLLRHVPHQGIQRLVADLNRVYRQEPALYQADFDSNGFEWLDFQDAEGSVIAFQRFAENRRESIIAVCNFTPVPRYGYRIGVSEPGFYREILNSDSEYYGGGNLGNNSGLDARPQPRNNRPYSLSLIVPPLSTLILKHT